MKIYGFILVLALAFGYGATPAEAGSCCVKAHDAAAPVAQTQAKPSPAADLPQLSAPAKHPSQNAECRCCSRTSNASHGKQRNPDDCSSCSGCGTTVPPMLTPALAPALHLILVGDLRTTADLPTALGDLTPDTEPPKAPIA